MHEIKHDGCRLMARCDAVGIQLLTRGGYDWAGRYPLIFEAVSRLNVHSCLIDGDAVCCDDDGVPIFQKLRSRQDDRQVILYASAPSTSNLMNFTSGIRSAINKSSIAYAVTLTESVPAGA